MVTPIPSPAVAEVFYPEADGQPMAETDVHRDLMIDLIAMLREYFRDDPHVYISGNLFLYYEEGNPRRVVAPDVFVVKGVPGGRRRIYKLWEEGQPPDVVFEVTSPSTRGEDLRTKHELYARLGVAEYFLFDPLDEYLRPPFQGYRLTAGPLRGAAAGCRRFSVERGAGAGAAPARRAPAVVRPGGSTVAAAPRGRAGGAAGGGGASHGRRGTGYSRGSTNYGRRGASHHRGNTCGGRDGGAASG